MHQARLGLVHPGVVEIVEDRDYNLIMIEILLVMIMIMMMTTSRTSLLLRTWYMNLLLCSHSFQNRIRSSWWKWT